MPLKTEWMYLRYWPSVQSSQPKKIFKNWLCYEAWWFRFNHYYHYYHDKKTSTLNHDSVKTTCLRCGVNAHEMAPAALSLLNTHRHGLALSLHAHGGLPWKPREIVPNYCLWQHSSQMTSQHQKKPNKKKTCEAAVRISGQLVPKLRIQEESQGVGADLFGLDRLECLSQVQPPILAKHATQLFLNRQSDAETTHHSSSGSHYPAEIISVYNAHADTEDKYTHVRARAHTRETASHSSAPCVQSRNGKSESCFSLLGKLPPSQTSHEATDCSTTFVRWLNVMSCLCYFSLSQLLGTRVASGTQRDTTTLPLVTSPITCHLLRLWSWGPLGEAGGGAGGRALLFPCLKALLSNLLVSGLNLRTLRNPKHVKHLATGMQWFIALSPLLHICLVHSLDQNFWLRSLVKMWLCEMKETLHKCNTTEYLQQLSVTGLKTR